MPLWMRQNAVRERAEEYEIVRQKARVMHQRYLSLLEVLQAHTTYLQVYRVVKYDESHVGEYSNDRRSSKYVFESFKILVGKVKESCWIGISPISSYVEFPDCPTPKKFLEHRTELNEAQKLESRLKSALDSVTFIRRQCYDVYEQESQYVFEFAETEDAVINRLLHLSNFVTTWEFEGMSLGDEGLEGDSDLKEKGKFDVVDQLLISHLQNLRVHIVGTISIFDIYAVGQAQSGDWLGVSTTAVWT